MHGYSRVSLRFLLLSFLFLLAMLFDREMENGDLVVVDLELSFAKFE